MDLPEFEDRFVYSGIGPVVVIRKLRSARLTMLVTRQFSFLFVHSQEPGQDLKMPRHPGTRGSVVV